MQFDSEINFEEHFDFASNLQLPVSEAFDEQSVKFLGALSKLILRDKESRTYSDLATFGYFCRESNIKKFAQEHLDRNFDNKRFGWGTCLHIAPSNIPMNFAFSFVMGFISGNKNIVRLPSKNFPQIEVFLKHFSALAATEHFKDVALRNHFVRTKRDSAKLLELVKRIDALVVWGGDSTVSHFRNMEKKVACVEVYFPDKVSSMVVNSDAILQLSDQQMQNLCTSFFNDTYLVDQNACSSPTVIYWVGESSVNPSARQRFSDYMAAYLSNNYDIAAINQVEKLIDVMRFCKQSGNVVQVKKESDKLWYLKSEDFKHIKPKLGLFIDKDLASLNELPELLRENEQTLIICGFKSEEILMSLSSQVNHLVDRIVPVGRALDIGFIWDGKNMINSLSKIVYCA